MPSCPYAAVYRPWDSPPLPVSNGLVALRAASLYRKNVGVMFRVAPSDIAALARAEQYLRFEPWRARRHARPRRRLQCGFGRTV